MKLTAWDILYMPEESWKEDIDRIHQKMCEQIKEATGNPITPNDPYKAIRWLEGMGQMVVFDQDEKASGKAELAPLSYDFLDLLHRSELHPIEPYFKSLDKAEEIILKYAVKSGVKITPDGMSEPLNEDNVMEWFNDIAMPLYINEVVAEVVYSNRDKFDMRFSNDGSFEHDELGNDKAILASLQEDKGKEYEFEISISVPVKVIAKSAEEAQKMIETSDVARAGIQAAVRSDNFCYGLSDIEPQFDLDEVEKSSRLDYESILKRWGYNDLSLVSYLEKYEDLVRKVLDNQGDMMDLDCMVAVSKVLGRNISYEEYSMINGTDMFDDMGLFNATEREKPVFEAILSGEVRNQYDWESYQEAHEEALAQEDGKTYSLSYEIEGYYSTSARTEEEAEYNIQEEDFGDLSDIEWEKEDVEETCDGQRNDRVNVVYKVTGRFEVEVTAPDRKLAEEKGKDAVFEADFGELEDIDSNLKNVEEIEEDRGEER